MRHYRDANDAYMNGGIEEEIPISPCVQDVERRLEQRKRRGVMVVEACRLVPPSFNDADHASQRR